MMRTGKQKRKTVFVLIAAVTIVFLLFRIVRSTGQVVMTSESKDGKYSLIISEEKDPDFPYGASHCLFILRRGIRTVVKQSVAIRNDGKHLDSSNFSVDWGDLDVAITVTAEEQDKTVNRMAYDGSYP